MHGSIVITGAAGMIGSGVVRHLNDLGLFRLVLVDDLKQGEKWKNLVGKNFIQLISKHTFFSWLEGRESEISAVVHLGACSDTMETNADYLMDNNVRFSIRLAEWALSHQKRFIYASSAATYGNGSRGFEDHEESLEELAPINMYAFSKHLFDLWMKQEKGLQKAVGLKYFNVFGPNEYHKGRMASMILKMTATVQTKGVLSLYKSNDPDRFQDGEQQRDFIYVKDAVRMTCQFLFKEYANCTGIFNIGRGEPVTWNALALALFKSLGQKPNICYIDMPSDVSSQYQNYTCADMRKWKEKFPHWIPDSIEHSIEDYVQNYLLPKSRW